MIRTRSGADALAKRDEELPLWPMVVVEPNEERFELRAGLPRVEALVLQYPREEQ